MHPTTSLGLDKESNTVNISEYRQMIGSLLYLTASKPDIMFSVCLRVRFQADPREVHLSAIKRIFRKELLILVLATSEEKILNCGDIVM